MLARAAFLSISLFLALSAAAPIAQNQNGPNSVMDGDHQFDHQRHGSHGQLSGSAGSESDSMGSYSPQSENDFSGGAESGDDSMDSGASHWRHHDQGDNGTSGSASDNQFDGQGSGHQRQRQHQHDESDMSNGPSSGYPGSSITRRHFQGNARPDEEMQSQDHESDLGHQSFGDHNDSSFPRQRGGDEHARGDFAQQDTRWADNQKDNHHKRWVKGQDERREEIHHDGSEEDHSVNGREGHASEGRHHFHKRHFNGQQGQGFPGDQQDGQNFQGEQDNQNVQGGQQDQYSQGERHGDSKPWKQNGRAQNGQSDRHGSPSSEEQSVHQSPNGGESEFGSFEKSSDRGDLQGESFQMSGPEGGSSRRRGARSS